MRWDEYIDEIIRFKDYQNINHLELKSFLYWLEEELVFDLLSDFGYCVEERETDQQVQQLLRLAQDEAHRLRTKFYFVFL